ASHRRAAAGGRPAVRPGPHPSRDRRPPGRRAGHRQPRPGRDRRAWRKESVRDMTELLNVELAKFDALEREYWAAWRQPQGRARRVAVAGEPTEPGNDEPASDASADWREFPGNPAFLMGVEQVIERRCKLLVLATPEKIAVVAPVKLVAGV